MMNASSNLKQIPASAKPFFQEYNLDLLDVEQHTSLVIERILAYGNRAEVRWLLDAVGREQVRDWVLRSGSSRLPWRRYHLWCFVFQLPLEEKPVRAWPY